MWFVFVAADIINGMITEVFASPELGEYNGYFFGEIRLIGFIIIVVYLLMIVPETEILTKFDLIFIGIFWVVLTILFEFLYMHYFRNKPWDMIFQSYDITKGRLAGLVLLLKLLLPFLLGIWRQAIVTKRYLNTDENIG